MQDSPSESRRFYQMRLGCVARDNRRGTIKLVLEK